MAHIGSFNCKEIGSIYSCFACKQIHNAYNIINSWRNQINAVNNHFMKFNSDHDFDNDKVFREYKMKFIPMCEVWAAYGPDFCLNGKHTDTKDFCWVQLLSDNLSMLNFVPKYPSKVDVYSWSEIKKLNKL